MMKDNFKMLFIGDSLMACARDSKDDTSMGYGYVSMIQQYLSTKYSPLNIEVINRGISGNRSAHILERFQRDALAFRPDLIFIGCGVNDAWHKFDPNCEIETSDEMFRECIEQVIQMAIVQNISVALIEPFLLNEPEIRRTYRSEFDPKRKIMRELAVKYDLFFIALDDPMLDLADKIGSEQVAGDGIHPTLLGHGFIADQIIDYFGWRKN